MCVRGQGWSYLEYSGEIVEEMIAKVHALFGDRQELGRISRFINDFRESRPYCLPSWLLSGSCLPLGRRKLYTGVGKGLVRYRRHV